jgi:hypothetical protein
LKNQLKRTNRGILLAGIAVVALVIYIIYDEVTFSNGVPEMRGQIHDFFDELAEVSLNAQDMKEQYINLINEVMIYPPNEIQNTNQGMGGWRYTMDKNHFLEQASVLDNSGGSVTKYEYRINRIDITKEGPGLASVNIRYMLTIETKGGAAAAVTPSGAELLDYHMYQWSPNFDGSQGDYNLEVRFEMSGNLYIETKRQFGQWKFYGMSGWNDMNDVTVLGGGVYDFYYQEDYQEDREWEGW